MAVSVDDSLDSSATLLRDAERTLAMERYDPCNNECIEMRSYGKRLLSFTNLKWTRALIRSPTTCPSKMAVNWYCTGTDTARCFACFKELEGWAPTDDPEAEHSSHCGHCPLIKYNLISPTTGLSNLTLRQQIRLDVAIEFERKRTMTRELWGEAVEAFEEMHETLSGKIDDLKFEIEVQPMPIRRKLRKAAATPQKTPKKKGRAEVTAKLGEPFAQPIIMVADKTVTDEKSCRGERTVVVVGAPSDTDASVHLASPQDQDATTETRLAVPTSSNISNNNTPVPRSSVDSFVVQKSGGTRVIVPASVNEFVSCTPKGKAKLMQSIREKVNATVLETPKKRTAKWFSETVPSLLGGLAESDGRGRKNFVGLLMRTPCADPVKSDEAPADSDEPLTEFAWGPAVEAATDCTTPVRNETTKTFRMSYGRNPDHHRRRETNYNPSNEAAAVSRINFKGFLDNEKAVLKRHRKVRNWRGGKSEERDFSKFSRKVTDVNDDEEWSGESGDENTLPSD